MMILMYNNDPGNLILVDGNEVINGSYKVKKEKDGTYSNSVTNFRAVFVKKVAMKPNWKLKDADDALDRCEKELRKKGISNAKETQEGN